MHKQNHVLSVQFENFKITEMAYLLGFPYVQSFTRDINTTVSTWLERIEWMSFGYVRSRKHIQCVFGIIGRREHIHLRSHCIWKGHL